jgi:O-methyltransferase involved in polyketide biosynthesis
MSDGARDFSSISPSARALLIMKSETSIPYAAEAARLAFGAEAVEAELAEMRREPLSGFRLQHFEARYRSIDTLLAASGLTRVLELGAGFSFRGLALAERPGVVYLDTDLPEMSALKADLVARLHPAPLGGRLEVAPLEALDAGAFRAAAARLAPGPLAVVNEGLLVYLDAAEKSRLAANVRAALREMGGVWITADIYVPNPPGVRPPMAARAREFLERHRVEENKFASFDAAERFFTGEGFTITQRLAPADAPVPIRESWVLSPR